MKTAIKRELKSARRQMLFGSDKPMSLRQADLMTEASARHGWTIRREAVRFMEMSGRGRDAKTGKPYQSHPRGRNGYVLHLVAEGHEPVTLHGFSGWMDWCAGFGLDGREVMYGKKQEESQ